MRLGLNSAWEALLGHYDDVLRFVGTRVLCSQTASDVVQDTFARALEASARGNVERPRALLFRTARNVLVDRRRREQCWQRHAPNLPAEPDLAACPHEQLERGERLERLRQAIDALPPKCREVFLLHRFSDMTYAQIAERTGVSVSTVEKHIIRALAACRAKLTDAAD